MIPLTKNVRFYVLVASGVLSLAIYAWVKNFVPAGTLQTIRLTEFYALTALAYLYTALLIGPAVYNFTWLPWRGHIFRARRAVGVSAFYFACLHADLAFFKLLGGFDGLRFLSGKYLLAISFSFTALLILTAMASTSFDRAVSYLTHRRWKKLHRLVYLAGILILTHALLLGTHFSDLTQTIPQIAFVALALLFFLEARRIDAYLTKKFSTMPQFGLATTLLISGIIVYIVLILFPTASNSLSLSIHARHLQQAQQAASQGDATKRFTVSFTHTDAIEPGRDTTLRFQIFDASNGAPIELFSPLYEKPAHLMIVDSALTYFSHLHPAQSETGFAVSTRFPKDSLYHLYLNFQPLGSPEQQFGFTLPVGRQETAATASQQPDTSLTKTFGQYDVSLNITGPLRDSGILEFTIRDTATKQPVTTLKPYLAAFGHLTMINEQTFESIHVHPTTVQPPASDAVSGPAVQFIPLGLYGPIKPGVYRLFAEFNPNGQLFTADFTIKID